MKQWKEVYQYVLGAIIVLCFFATVILMIIMKPQDNPVLYSMVGTLGTIATMVATYFFGSSKGSQSKDETIKDLKKNEK